LTDLTSFVGKIKNKEKSSKALKSIEIPILRQRLEQRDYETGIELGSVNLKSLKMKMSMP